MRKTDSHPHFQHSHGSIFSMEMGPDGSISCSPGTLINGTISYISVAPRRDVETSCAGGGPAVVLPFPTHHDRARVADVASKLARIRTRRHAHYYCEQVAQGLDGKLRRKGVAEDQRKREVTRFWQAVTLEVVRLQRTGGGA